MNDISTNVIRPGFIAPDEMYISLDERFQELYDNEAWVTLPPVIREAIWWHREGLSLQRLREAHANAETASQREAYIRECIRIEKQNERIRIDNKRRIEEARRNYRRQRQAYRPPTPERYEKLRVFLRQRLEKLLGKQKAFMRARLAGLVPKAIGLNLAAFSRLAICLVVWLFGVLSFYFPKFVAHELLFGIAGSTASVKSLGALLQAASTPFVLVMWTHFVVQFTGSLCALLSGSGCNLFRLRYLPPSQRDTEALYTPALIRLPGGSGLPPWTSRGCSHWNLDGVVDCPPEDLTTVESDPYNTRDYDTLWVICGVLLLWVIALSSFAGWFFPLARVWFSSAYSLVFAILCVDAVTCLMWDAPLLRSKWNSRPKRLLTMFDYCFANIRERYLNRTEPRLASKYVSVRKERPYPAPYKPVTPKPVHPPASVYDDGTRGNYEHVLRGTRVFSYEDVRRFACHELFADGKVRPYACIGGTPLSLCSGQPPNTLILGTAGSGKTTTIRSLMASTLPLTGRDAAALFEDGFNEPATRAEPILPPPSHLWSRSFTYQAVVYNAKGENIPYLAGFGFAPSQDLIILDPADSRCHAWDLAADIDDRTSIRKFSEIVVPDESVKPGDTNRKDHFDNKARRLVEAAIISLRNMAKKQGRRPNWNFRDLVCAFRDQDTLRSVLQWHDDFEAIKAELLDLDPRISDSNFTTATEYVRAFDITAARWERAEKEGRKVSLKRWLKHCPFSVLVLPNTLDNKTVNEKLNQMFVKFLTNEILDHDTSFDVDMNGASQPRRRYFFFDEVGQAGGLTDLERLMTEGRTFGVEVVLGVHQLSHMRKVYGGEGTETILGLCNKVALLKNGDPTTRKWASERIGECLREYERKSFSYGTSEGVSFTKSTGSSSTDTAGTSQQWGSGSGSSSTPNQHRHGTSQTTTTSWNTNSTNGISESSSKGHSEQESVTRSYTKSEQTTVSFDLRQEPSVYASEFGGLPDTKKTGLLGGYYIVPSLPVWRADLPIEDFVRRMPSETSSVPAALPWTDEAASVLLPWDERDKQRLGLEGGNFQSKSAIANGRARLPTEFDSIE